MKHRSYYVDVVRSCACILVVASHVFAPVCAGMNSYSRGTWWVFNLLDSVIRPSAGLFIMISGKIFIGSSRQNSYFQFVAKRYSKVFLPFFVWSLVYAFYEARLQETPLSLGRAILNILQGPTEYHLWFMYVILGLYLIMPLLRRFVRSASPRGLASALALWMGLLLFQFFYPHGLRLNPLWLFLSYSGYAMLGYALDKSKTVPSKIGWCLFLWGLIVIFNAVGTYVFTLENGGILNEKLYFGAAPLVAVQTAVMFLLLKNINSESIFYKRSWIRAGVSGLSRQSYNIYLNHALILWLFAKDSLGFILSHDTGPSPLIGVSLTTAAVLASSLGLSVVLQHIPVLSKLFVIPVPPAKPVENPSAPC